MPKKMTERSYEILPLTKLTAISTVDGRYRDLTEELAPHVSEYNLFRIRLEVEAKYLIALSEVGLVRGLSRTEVHTLSSFGPDLTLEEAEEIKRIEEKLQHDVKAIETAFRQEVKGTSLEDITEMIHYGITSEDINNVAYRLQLARATKEVMIPNMELVLDTILRIADENKDLPMLARTHGQPAVPTTLGKEFVNFASRLYGEIRKLQEHKLTGKLTGAVGNLNALTTLHPDVDWLTFSSNFVKSLGLTPVLSTTQINPYEDIIDYLQNYMRINGIIIDLDQDMWRYISDKWLALKVVKEEVGSSTMPQKVNPIRFENSEGNLIIANALLGKMSEALGQSRLQRDLRDSTIIRNLGLSLAFCLVSYKNTNSGLNRLITNRDQIQEDLNKDWSILSELAQILLRKAGVKDAYDLVKALSRGIKINQDQWQQWLNSLPVSDEAKLPMTELTPENYIGLAVKITKKEIRRIQSGRKKLAR